MDMKTIKDELWLISKAYPTLAGLMMKKLPSGQAVGSQWAKIMLHSSNLDAVHLKMSAMSTRTWNGHYRHRWTSWRLTLSRKSKIGSGATISGRNSLRSTTSAIKCRGVTGKVTSGVCYAAGH